jgi:hypothetical protein
MKARQTMTKEIRPEDELLLGCARVRLDPEGDRGLRELAQKALSWDYLLLAAARHGLMPLLYRHLHTTCADVMPGHVLERLRELVYANAARNLLLTSELLAILSLLQVAGVAVIPFRGPTLAAFAYGDLSLRQFNDLDLLIRREDLPRAREALATRDYQPVLGLPAHLEAAFVQSQYDFELINATTGIMVELHWEIVPSYLALQIEPQVWWEGVEHLTLGGTEVPVLSPEHLLLAVCTHSTKHMWERLGWIADVAALLDRRPEMDWGKAMDLAQRAQAERLLLLGLFLAKDLLGAALPGEVRLRLEAYPQVKSLAPRVRRRLFRTPGYRYELLETIPFHFRLRQGLGNKMRYCVHLAFSPSPEDWVSRRLPASLSSLHALLRPFRLLGRHLIGLDRKR